MAEAKIAINRPNSANTPPNCAICLGSCSNKCFSDSCMHQFCFQCLLEWSRIKAECPLCKQPFKSIIHNVKSNEEYDEHVVETPRNEEVGFLENDNMLFLPLPHAHGFHFRTTFTVDSRGEHAIQQMLLAHPLTTGGRITVNTGIPNLHFSTRTLFPSRHRRDFSATSFRRSIYAQNLWANALPDLTGRYRECSPIFFRNNPGARQRLVPWLNRELNALLYENTQLIMHLVDLIMDHLLRHHICSRSFRNTLREYLDTKTDQFVHEFYSFMRSPFDMVGYDRNVIYTTRPQSPAPLLEDDTVEIPDNSDDSDVVLVGEINPAEPVTINLVESNSDSDEPVIVSSGSQVPMPLLIPGRTRLSPEPVTVTTSSSPVAVVNLPPKLRYKNFSLAEKEKYRRIKKRMRHRSRSRSSRSSSSSSSDERNKKEKQSYRKYKRRKLLKKLKQKKHRHIDSPNSSSEVNITSESDADDNKPLIDIIKKMKKGRSKRDKKRRVSRHDDYVMAREQPRVDTSPQRFPIDLSRPSCSRFSNGSSSISSSKYHIELPKTRSTVELSNNGQYTSVQIETSSGLADNYEPTPSKTKIKIVRNGRNSPQHSKERRDYEESGSSSSGTEPYRIPIVKSEIREVKYENPGPSRPSTSKPLPLVLKREHNRWYVFGETDSSD